jgi:hypothetical protein
LKNSSVREAGERISSGRAFWPAVAMMAAVVLLGVGTGWAQDSGFHLNMNAGSHATAAQVGLPVYPGATVYKDKDKGKDEDSGADIGLAFGDFHLVVKVAPYVSSDAPDKILAFYRKPLSKFGEVLECNHGKPVGALTVTKSGLTCSEQKGGTTEINGSNSSDDHELRAGSPHQFRIVGIEEPKAGATRFSMVYLELPKDDKAK